MPIAKAGWRHCKDCRRNFLMRSANPKVIKEWERTSNLHRRGPNPACNCGTCPHCRNIAKWEAVWQRKFAAEEAAYYRQPYEPLRASSSLALKDAGNLCTLPHLPVGIRRIRSCPGDVSY